MITLNSPEDRAHSATLCGVAYYSVRAISTSGAVMTFGIQAPEADPKLAMNIALDRVPWYPEKITVTREIPAEARDASAH